MPTNPIIDVTLNPEGKPASVTITSHTQGTQQPNPAAAAPPAPVVSTTTIAVAHEVMNNGTNGTTGIPSAGVTNSEVVKTNT